MSRSARDEYLDGVDERLAPLVIGLDGAVRGAGAELDTAIKYRMLTYAVGADFHHWVCAIDAHPRKGVALRFLFGDMLDFSGVGARPGSTTMRTIDHASLDQVDDRRVATLVAEAVSRLDEFRAREREARRAKRP